MSERHRMKPRRGEPAGHVEQPKGGTLSGTRRLAFTALLLSIAIDSRAQEPRRGVIVDDVKCEAEPAQTYALYVPSTYSHDRPWNLLIAFHPAARGRLMV